MVLCDSDFWLNPVHTKSESPFSPSKWKGRLSPCHPQEHVNFRKKNLSLFYKLIINYIYSTLKFKWCHYILNIIKSSSKQDPTTKPHVLWCKAGSSPQIVLFKCDYGKIFFDFSSKIFIVVPDKAGSTNLQQIFNFYFGASSEKNRRSR